MKTLMVLLSLVSIPASALETGRPAPDFSLTGTSEKVKLSDHKGKTVVLEWLNHGCPFVRKHYDSGNMQALQKKFTDKGVTWLSIVSSKEGKQGYVDQKGAVKEKSTHKSHATDILLDPTGEVGKLYGAKTTPHMYIIDPKGNLVYQGAIDDRSDTDTSSIASAKNFVAKALDEVLAGKKVTQHTTRAYGCSVKY
jgi:peroxiredoxin